MAAVKRKCIKVAVKAAEQQALKADSSTKTPTQLTTYSSTPSITGMKLAWKGRPIGSALAFTKLANLQG